MIKSFKSKGLENFYTTGSKKGIQPEHAKKLSLQLFALNQATRPGELDVPGWNLHPLKHWGDDFWAFVDRMRKGRRLVITSDHGYATSKWADRDP